MKTLTNFSRANYAQIILINLLFYLLCVSDLNAQIELKPIYNPPEFDICAMVTDNVVYFAGNEMNIVVTPTKHKRDILYEVAVYDHNNKRLYFYNFETDGEDIDPQTINYKLPCDLEPSPNYWVIVKERKAINTIGNAFAYKYMKVTKSCDTRFAVLLPFSLETGVTSSLLCNPGKHTIYLPVDSQLHNTSNFRYTWNLQFSNPSKPILNRETDEPQLTEFFPLGLTRVISSSVSKDCPYSNSLPFISNVTVLPNVFDKNPFEALRITDNTDLEGTITTGIIKGPGCGKKEEIERVNFYPIDNYGFSGTVGGNAMDFDTVIWSGCCENPGTISPAAPNHIKTIGLNDTIVREIICYRDIDHTGKSWATYQYEVSGNILAKDPTTKKYANIKCTVKGYTNFNIFKEPDIDDFKGDVDGKVFGIHPGDLDSLDKIHPFLLELGRYVDPDYFDLRYADTVYLIKNNQSINNLISTREESDKDYLWIPSWGIDDPRNPNSSIDLSKIPIELGQRIYYTLYSKDKEEKFFNLSHPLKSDIRVIAIENSSDKSVYLNSKNYFENLERFIISLESFDSVKSSLNRSETKVLQIEKEKKLLNEIVRTFDVYPNPNHGTLHISNIQSERMFGSVALYDVNGKLIRIFMNENIGNNFTLDISELKSGFYLIQLMDDVGNSLGFEKIIKN